MFSNLKDDDSQDSKKLAKLSDLAFEKSTKLILDFLHRMSVRGGPVVCLILVNYSRLKRRELGE